ncbi:MAG: rod shape-determining protein RodA [Clostridia bacterium]|nr:rod shape-determining protein RodA [Clostridia bacterium]
MLKRFFSREGADIKLLAAVLISAIFGIVMINSATTSLEGNFVLIQSLALVIGLIAAIIITLIDYSLLYKLRYVAMAVGIALLVLVLVLGFGREDTGTQGWIDLGFVNIQPAEIAKVCFLVSFSAHVSRIKEDINAISNILLLILHLAVPVVLILLQPDMGTALVFVFMFIVMMFFAGISYRYIAVASGAGVVIALAAWFGFLNDIQKARFFSFLNPEADPLGTGYHIIQSKIAVGSGQLFGTGYGEGIQTQMGYLPEKQTDFIFSVICEELGFMGAICVIALLFFIIFRIFINARRAKDTFGEMLCAGAAAMLFFHTVENIGMCINLLPITGIPLPFFSYGGSNMITSMIAIGIVLSVSFHRKNNTFL